MKIVSLNELQAQYTISNRTSKSPVVMKPYVTNFSTRANLFRNSSRAKVDALFLKAERHLEWAEKAREKGDLRQYAKLKGIADDASKYARKIWRRACREAEAI